MSSARLKLACLGILCWPFVLAGADPVSPATQRPLIQQVDERALDPARDGWVSESTSAQVSSEFKRLAKALCQTDLPTALDEWSEVVVTLPSPEALRTLREDPQFTVLRSDATPAAVTTGMQAVAHFIAPTAQLTRAKFKVIGIQLNPQQVTTQQRCEFFAGTEDRLLELHADATATWQRQPEATPRLTELTFASVDLVSRPRPAGRLFQDQTEAVMGSVPAYTSQLQLGIDAWLQRLDKMLTDQFGHHGLAVVDINADHRDDLYVCQPGGLPNLLLLQQADGTLRRVTDSGLDVLDLSRSALFLDFDNDDDQDLVLATASQVVFFRQARPLQFERVAAFNISDANSLAASDVDRDGDLDVYVCVYSGDGGESRASPTPIPIHDARNGGTNVLLRCESLGDSWQFVDATARLGLGVGNDRWSYSASWEDYDNDGDEDLYVANDFGRNNLYRNDGGQFREVSAEAGLDEAAFGMSVSWGDYDRDGLMDVYVSNMFSGAGNRVVPQPQFQPDGSASFRKQMRYAARGNSLFRNQGEGKFADVSEQAGVTFGRWAWGSLFADIDNDGWEDLLVGNGFVTRQHAPDL